MESFAVRRYAEGGAAPAACMLCARGRQRRDFMKSIFLDCNDRLAPVWARVIRPDDPKIDVNTEPFAREELPLVLAGYGIALDDHSYMPTALVAQCPELKHIVFLGTGPASYMNCLLYTSPSPRDGLLSRMPSSA